MKKLLVSATIPEIKPFLEKNGIFNNGKTRGLFHGTKNIDFLVTGPGSVQTAWAMGKLLSIQKYSLIINAGIAGGFPGKHTIGDVVNVASDCFADQGAEDHGEFLTLFELNLLEKNETPFANGILRPIPFGEITFKEIPQTAGITVNKAHGNQLSINRIIKKFNPGIESMEGASVFYCCGMEGIPSIQIRSVSNMVEPRNREAWDIPLAIKNLNKFLEEKFL